MEPNNEAVTGQAFSTYSVFVSHANADEVDHTGYIPGFERQGLKTTIDQSFPAGEDWYYSILDGLLRCDVIVGLVTDNALSSDWVVQELGFGASMGYVYLIGKSEMIEELKVRAARDEDRDSILPVCKTLLRFEFDIVKPETSFAAHLAQESTIERIREFAKTRAAHQKSYRERFAKLLEDEAAIDESLISSSSLLSILSARHLARKRCKGVDSSTEGEHQQVLASRMRALKRHFQQLQMASAHSALIDYEKEDLIASIQHNTDSAESSLAAATDDALPVQLRHNFDLFLIHQALAIAERHILVHLLIREGRLDLAFNTMGSNSQAVHVYSEACLRVIDDLSNRGVK